MFCRLYVEKRPGFDTEANLLRDSLNADLGLTLSSVRILVRYDIENLPDAAFDLARDIIFSEPPADKVYNVLPECAWSLTVQYLPGQFDQRADSAAHCVRLLSDAACVIACAKVYLFSDILCEGDRARIRKYLINPVDQREIGDEVPRNLTEHAPTPGDIPIVAGFIRKSPAELEEYHRDMAFAMSIADLAFVRRYFAETEKRDPTLTELRVLDTYWSDHCRHTTFLTELEEVSIEEGVYSTPIRRTFDKYRAQAKPTSPLTLMTLATAGMKRLKAEGKLDDLDVSDEINACSIRVPVDVDGDIQTWLIQFKNETHNHPTEIEPFGGAATCLGGAIRDPLSGRAYVYQAMRITGSGDPRVPLGDTRPGKLPQRKICMEAAHGFSSYGNQIGLATGHVCELYDEGYAAKRMEIGAVVGAVPESAVKRSVPRPGDVILLVGGRTGRDGIGGATGSSKAHTEASTLLCGAEVQKGNPPTERKIQRLFRDPELSRLIRRCNDFGAGGVAVAIGEIADGVRIDLDRVPKKYDGLDGTELAISESQERMAVCVDSGDADAFMCFAAKENVEATAVAVVTNTARLQMIWRGRVIVDVSRAFLDTNGARASARARVAAPKPDMNFFARPEPQGDIKSKWMDMLSDLNVCSQKGLVQRFDSSIGAGTVLSPFGGLYEQTPAEVMAAKIPVQGGTSSCTIMAHGGCPELLRWSPFHGAVYAVVEAAAKITACGGDYAKIRLSFQEYFERMSAPETWGKPLAALLGAYLAQTELGIPAIGGKDSMSGSFGELSVPPTFVAFGVAAARCDDIISPEFKRAGSVVIEIPLPRGLDELPNFAALRSNYAAIRRLIQKGLILSAHTVKAFGIAEAVSKMCFGNRIGFRFEDGLSDRLFRPDFGSMVLELSPECGARETLGDVPFILLGHTFAEPAIIADGVTIPLNGAVEVWEKPLQSVYPVAVDQGEGRDVCTVSDKTEVPSSTSRRMASGAKFACPHVFIPVFMGTNCEYDSARAFEKAGADVETFVFKNLTAADVSESVERMRRLIERAQIVMLPGGFSAGDEPDGSGKFIAAVFRSPALAYALTELMEKRDGLILGICNGFQALMKLGLLPDGHIHPLSPDSPTLTFNAVGRHVSRIVRTAAATNRSPWLAGVRPGDIFAVPVSHGEGRFVCDGAHLDALRRNDQIAFRYASAYPSDAHYNPNGSEDDIEGIVSPDGRILGKMGHSERVGESLYKNVPGNYDQGIFESGVRYYR